MLDLYDTARYYFYYFTKRELYVKVPVFLNLIRRQFKCKTLKTPLGICLKDFAGEDIINSIQALFSGIKGLEFISSIFSGEILQVLARAFKYLPKEIPGVETINSLISIANKSKSLGALLPKCKDEDLTNPSSEIFSGDETACYVY